MAEIWLLIIAPVQRLALSSHRISEREGQRVARVRRLLRTLAEKMSAGFGPSVERGRRGVPKARCRDGVTERRGDTEDKWPKPKQT